MEKYNLSVAVMHYDDPIMFLYSKDRIYVSTNDRPIYTELARLFPLLDFTLLKGVDDGKSYCEYVAYPDEEVKEDTFLLAIFQEIK